MNTIITAYNQSVRLETREQKVLNAIDVFLRQFYRHVAEGFNAQAPPVISVYVGKTEKYHSYLFSNSQFRHLLYYLKQQGILLDKATQKDERDYKSRKIKYKVRKNWVLREEQVPVVEFILKDSTGTKLVPLATGVGKTFVALNALAEIGEFFAVVIEPKFMDKWVNDIIEIHEATKDDIACIGGTNSVSADMPDGVTQLTYRDIIAYGIEGKVPWKYLIFSLTSYRNFIKDYEEDPEECFLKYGCTPIDMFPLLKVGALLIDEAHIAYHAVFRTVIHANVKFQLSLSATMIPRNDVERRAQTLLYPADRTYHKTLIKKYLILHPILYRLGGKFRYMVRYASSRDGKSGKYSHITLEKCIMKNKQIQEVYFELIEEMIDTLYMEHCEEGQKHITFVAMVEFATRLVEWLKPRYPGKTIVRYTGGDSYDDLIAADMSVSTGQSAGTGLDIPCLISGLQTVSIAAEGLNIQIAGRLRFIKGVDVRFGYLVCVDIPNHKKHHLNRLEIFKPRTAKIEPLRAVTIVQ